MADDKLRVMRDTYEDAYIYTGNNSLRDTNIICMYMYVGLEVCFTSVA